MVCNWQRRSAFSILKSTIGPDYPRGSRNKPHSLSNVNSQYCQVADVAIANLQHVTQLIFVCESSLFNHLWAIKLFFYNKLISYYGSATQLLSCYYCLALFEEAEHPFVRTAALKNILCANSNTVAHHHPKLDSLPSELQLQICKRLDPTSAICLSITCRTLNSIYEKEKLRRRPPYLPLYLSPQWNLPGRRSKLGVLLSKWMEPRIWDEYIEKFTTQAQMKEREQSRLIARLRMRDTLFTKRNKWG